MYIVQYISNLYKKVQMASKWMDHVKWLMPREEGRICGIKTIYISAAFIFNSLNFGSSV